ncbi:DUF1672 family protein [Heyndrickxia sporothermodurans]
MKPKKKMIVLGIGMSLILGGCFNLGSSTGKSNETLEEKHENEYVSVQDYNGEGYYLPNGGKIDEVAKAHRDEIDIAVKKFFKEKYKTEVKVHNVVGAIDGASVFVESVGEPHFHTNAIVPIDVQSKKIMTNEVWSQEKEVEKGIQTGLYKLVNEEAYKHLDNYIEKLIKEYPVVGKTEDAINNTGAVGLMTPYYYVDIAGKSLESLYNEYLKNPNITKKQLKSKYNPNSIDPKKISITIQLFMKEKKVAPDKTLFNQIGKDIEKATDFPKGSYNILLHDNLILKRTGIGVKDNSLERGYPNSILKE